MPYCVVKSCKNNNIGKVYTGLSFHKFPRDPFLRDKWTQIIRKTKKNDSWNPSDYCVVCSAHFDDEDLYSAKTGLRRLRNDAIPTKNIFLNATVELGHDSLDLVKPAKAKTKCTRKLKKFADVSVKSENDSSDSDEPLQRTQKVSPPKLISEVTTTTQSNRKIIYFDATSETKKDSVEGDDPKSLSTLAATSTNNYISMYEDDDPLSIKEEIKIEIDSDDQDLTDNISTTPPQSNIAIISVKHEPNKKKRDAENKQKDGGKKKKKIEKEAVEEENLFGDLKKDYARMGPTVYRLQKDVTRLQQLRVKYKKKLKTLQQQIRRLKTRNASLKSKIKSIKGSTIGQNKESCSSEMQIAENVSDNESMSPSA